MTITLDSIIPVDRLVKVRREAQKKKAWFKVLRKRERDIMNLTINCVKAVRSPILAKIVKAIITKLKKALESHVERLVRTIGRSTALELCRIAESWGNKLAHQWNEDDGFARYLAVTYHNQQKLNRGRSRIW